MDGHVIVGAIAAFPVGTLLLFFAGYSVAATSAWDLKTRLTIALACGIAGVWCLVMGYRILCNRPRPDGSLIGPLLLVPLSSVVGLSGLALAFAAIEERSIHTAVGAAMFLTLSLSGVALGIQRTRTPNGNQAPPN